MTTTTQTYTPRAGDRVRLDNRYDGTVLRIARTGSVSISGYRGWITTDRLVLVARPSRAEWIAEVTR